MAIGQKPASGNGPNTGMPKTPAPTKRFNPSTNVKDFKAGYGTNLDPGPSSAPVGSTRTSALADDLHQFAQKDGELDDIIREGTAKSHAGYDVKVGTLDSDQLRKIAAGNLPTHSGMKRQQNPDALPHGKTPGKLPAKSGSPTSDWDTRRAAALTRAK